MRMANMNILGGFLLGLGAGINNTPYLLLGALALVVAFVVDYNTKP